MNKLVCENASKMVFGHVCVFCVCSCLFSNWDCELIKSIKVIWKSLMFPNLLCQLTPYVPTQKLLSTGILQWVPHVVCWIHNPLTQCLLQQWGSLHLNDTVRAVLNSFWHNFVILNLSTWSAKGARLSRVQSPLPTRVRAFAAQFRFAPRSKQLQI